MDFLVARDDLRRYEVRDDGAASLQPGEATLRVSSFALTANNITYAAFGDLMRYWDFFPGPPGWGRVPVWGFADVAESRVEGLVEGVRVFGYFPMSTELVVTPQHVTASGFVDGVAHRAALPPVYNQYQFVSADHGYDPAREAEQSLLRPLFMTSFLIDDWLADNDLFGAQQAILSSASSKTALGLAFLLSTNERCEVIGLTSPANAEFVSRVGYYDRTVTYGSLADEPSDRPTVFVDMAGDGAVMAEVHRHHVGSLVHSCRVGATHWEELAPAPDLPGPVPTLFFAPDHVVKRREDWGPGGLDERFGGAWTQFLGSVDGWLEIVEGHGPDVVAAVYLDVLEGRARPDHGNVVSL